jgi:hypothetical protein
MSNGPQISQEIEGDRFNPDSFKTFDNISGKHMLNGRMTF